MQSAQSTLPLPSTQHSFYNNSSNTNNNNNYSKANYSNYYSVNNNINKPPSGYAHVTTQTYNSPSPYYSSGPISTLPPMVPSITTATLSKPYYNGNNTIHTTNCNVIDNKMMSMTPSPTQSYSSSAPYMHSVAESYPSPASIPRELISMTGVTQDAAVTTSSNNHNNNNSYLCSYGDMTAAAAAASAANTMQSVLQSQLLPPLQAQLMQSSPVMSNTLTNNFFVSPYLYTAQYAQQGSSNTTNNNNTNNSNGRSSTVAGTMHNICTNVNREGISHN
uniref:Uncharacterized protein n=1 Tax=Lygus hesperus TaxID=30085 RepID=A0A0A9YDC2_LYGHE